MSKHKSLEHLEMWYECMVGDKQNTSFLKYTISLVQLMLRLVKYLIYNKYQYFIEKSGDTLDDIWMAGVGVARSPPQKLNSVSSGTFQISIGIYRMLESSKLIIRFIFTVSTALMEGRKVDSLTDGRLLNDGLEKRFNEILCSQDYVQRDVKRDYPDNKLKNSFHDDNNLSKKSIKRYFDPD
ncbi:uncharacterized protein TRIADDRAFT_57364 [Trichoplax adhaerens]|uniref:Uncharacterized protein n=1 Tax=Trichoplax adhaerens TaxID=10228 RepID=B3RZ86_TRIAD|nr:predicted protein [Trichoplax adhaerens]EDV23800.1 predicted protein [Trichoplax adhaerens]|eukprot:XP_002113326.1 predicted protein [Trichoplax adhaerens]